MHTRSVELMDTPKGTIPSPAPSKWRSYKAAEEAIYPVIVSKREAKTLMRGIGGSTGRKRKKHGRP